MTMRVTRHTQPAYASAIRALMPPGDAWQWPTSAEGGGLGAALIEAPAYELARIDAEVQALLDAHVEMHRPKDMSWRLIDYRAVAALSQEGVVEAQRLPFVAGSAAGARLWSASPATFSVDLVRVDTCRPFSAGSAAGDRLWGPAARYWLLVSYYATVADLDALVSALSDFKQAHMHLFFLDITGDGGGVFHA